MHLFWKKTYAYNFVESNLTSFKSESDIGIQHNNVELDMLYYEPWYKWKRSNSINWVKYKYSVKVSRN